MSTVIPDGWVEINLGKIIELKYGKSLPAKTRDGVGAPVYGSNGIVGKHSVPLVSTPGIVVGRKGSFGEVTLASEPFSPIDTTYFVDEFCGQPLMYWFYQLKNLPLTSLNRSTAIPGLNREDAYEQVISLPPLAEQKVIADKLDELLAQVESTKARLNAIPAILKSFRQAVLAAAVSGKLTEEWRGDKSHELGNGLPDSWANKAAKEVCLKVQSGSTPRNNPFDQGGKVPFLKVYNIVNQRIDFDYKPQFVTVETHSEKLKRSVGLPNDILMNIVGPPLGKVAVLTSQYPEWNLNQALTLFRVDPEYLEYKYLYYVLCEGELVRNVMPDTKGSVGQINISLTQCREALIPIPPLEEQAEIVRCVEELFAFADKVEAQVSAAQARVNSLTQSILAEAFRGELTADWRAENPDLISGENSAEALLERIKAEREALVKATKGARKKPVKKVIVKNTQDTGIDKKMSPVEAAIANGLAHKPQEIFDQLTPDLSMSDVFNEISKLLNDNKIEEKIVDGITGFFIKK